MNLKWTAAAVMALALAAPAMGQLPPKPGDPDPPAQPPRPVKPDRPEKREPPEDGASRTKHAGRLAERFGVTEKVVLELRDRGMGWGEIKHALSISQRSGQPLSEVLKLRDSGMGWGQIAQRYGFKLGEGAGKRGGKGEEAAAPDQGKTRIEPPRGRPDRTFQNRTRGSSDGAAPGERGRGRGNGRGRS